LLVLLVELGLRIGGYGFPTSAVVKYEKNGREALCDNYKFSWRFFPPTIAREFDPFIFPAKKGKNTYRIFIFGSSPAQGVPDGAFGFGRILQVMLREKYPGVTFEVINTAITAINSHVVLEIAKDCAKYQADLFVVYMGNNEVVGPYGPGTLFTPISSSLSFIRLGIAFNTTKIGQLLSNLIGLVGSKSDVPKEWGGLEMFLGNQVRHDDPRLKDVYRHFRENLLDIARTAGKNNSSVIFSTVGCNLKDSPPFASQHRSDMSQVDKLNWQEIYNKGVELETAGRYGKAAEQYLAAAEIDNQYADLHFRLGRCYWALGRYEKAGEKYTRAREQDTLRFRADNKINEIIREAVGNSSRKGVYLADVTKVFRENSPRGIPGTELFYEHVHLKFHGNYLLAKAVFQQVEKTLPATVKASESDNARLLTEEECARHLAYTPWDRYSLAENVLNNYIKNPPYSNQLYHEQRVQELEQQIRYLYIGLNPETFRKAGFLYRQAVDKNPSDCWLHKKYAQFLYKGLKKNKEAAQQYSLVKECLPHSYEGYSGLGFVLGRLGQFAEAISQSLEAIHLHPFKADVHNNLALTYQKSGNIEKAIEHYSAAIRIRPQYMPAYHNLGLLLNREGRVEEAVDLCRRGLTLMPESINLYYNLAFFLKTLGKKEEAIAKLQFALTIDPNSMKIRRLLNELLQEKSNY